MEVLATFQGNSSERTNLLLFAQFWLRLFLRRVRCKRSQGDIDVNIDVSWIIMASLFLDEQCS